jgi:hypothetical protein
MAMMADFWGFSGEIPGKGFLLVVKPLQNSVHFRRLTFLV